MFSLCTCQMYILNYCLHHKRAKRPQFCIQGPTRLGYANKYSIPSLEIEMTSHFYHIYQQVCIAWSSQSSPNGSTIKRFTWKPIHFPTQVIQQWPQPWGALPGEVRAPGWLPGLRSEAPGRSLHPGSQTVPPAVRGILSKRQKQLLQTLSLSYVNTLHGAPLTSIIRKIFF